MLIGMLAAAISIRLSSVISFAGMKAAVGACRYGVSLGIVLVVVEMATEVEVRGVEGVLSGGAEIGVLCLEADRLSRALAFAPGPFLLLGAMLDGSVR